MLSFSFKLFFNIKFIIMLSSLVNNKLTNESCFPKLSFKERLIGFTFCFTLGMVLEILSFGAFIGNIL